MGSMTRRSLGSQAGRIARAGTFVAALAAGGALAGGCGDTTIVQTVKTVDSPSRSPDRTVKIGDQFHEPTLVAPRQISLWVSDALVRLKWRNWGQPTATATGKVTDHPGGNLRFYPATVVAAGIGRCGGRVVYTRLAYRIFGKWQDAAFDNCRFAAAPVETSSSADEASPETSTSQQCEPVPAEPAPSTVKAINIDCDVARSLVRALTFEGRPTPGWVWLNAAGCEGFIVHEYDRQSLINNNYEVKAGMSAVFAVVTRGCTD